MSISLSQNYMLAAPIPLLQGAPLCQFLVEMDEEEKKVVAAELEPLNAALRELDENNSYIDIFSKSVGFGFAAGGTFVAGVCSMVTGCNREYNWTSTDDEYFESTLKLGGLFSSICGIAYCVERFKKYQREKAIVTENFSSRIDTNRILRLKDKVRKIETRQTQNIGEEKEQLDRSKDYFNQIHLEMVAAKANTTRVVHYRV